MSSNRGTRVAFGMGGGEGSKPVAPTAFCGLAILSWKWMWLSGAKREEIIIKAKHFICFISHWIHYLLGNKYYYFVNVANWNFNEIKWLDQQVVSFQNPSSSSKRNNVYDATVWTKSFKTHSQRNDHQGLPYEEPGFLQKNTQLSAAQSKLRGLRFLLLLSIPLLTFNSRQTLKTQALPSCWIHTRLP